MRSKEFLRHHPETNIAASARITPAIVRIVPETRRHRFRFNGLGGQM